MFDKEYYMRHRNIWAIMRSIARHIEGKKKDRIHYSVVEKKDYKKTKQHYSSLKNEIISDIYNSKEHLNLLPLVDRWGSVYINNIQMLSNNGDQMGKVFSYNGEIYRGFYNESAKDFARIWNEGVLQCLWKRGLIPELEISQYYNEEFPLIVHTKKVYIQKNTNWSYAMIRDACILVAFLNDILREFNCTLMDGHLNNVTFNNGRVMFVDIGSIIPFRFTAVQEELVFCGLFRLLFGFLGNCMLYRMPVFDMSSGTAFVEPRFYNQMTRDYRYCLSQFKKYHLIHGNWKLLLLAYKCFDLYHVHPEDIEVLFPISEQKMENDVNLPDYVYFILKEYLNKKTIVDVGGGAEYINYFVRRGVNFCNIFFIDYNEKRLDYVYQTSKESNLGASNALINYIYIQNDDHLDEYKSDTVLCVDPRKNSISYQTLNANTVAYQLSMLGNRYLILIFTEEEYEFEKELLLCLQKYYQMEIITDGNCFSIWKGLKITNA